MVPNNRKHEHIQGKPNSVNQTHKNRKVQDNRKYEKFQGKLNSVIQTQILNRTVQDNRKYEHIFRVNLTLSSKHTNVKQNDTGQQKT